jgi:Undecaprenyl-phosphate galactose phosphotransferase WbaP
VKHFGKETLHFYVATSNLPDRERSSSAKWQLLAKQITVLGVLIVADLAAVTLSFLMALSLRMWLATILGHAPVAFAYSFTTLGYALLMWPALLWQQGLYPGYGLSGTQQLRRQVTASFYGGALFATASVFFYRDLPVPRAVFILMVVISMILLPIVRALSKRLLLHFNLWGSQVVVLGAGGAGQRIVKAMKAKPLEGLHPVAIFDDDQNKIASRIEGISVVGPLSEADGFAKHHGIQHAVVAIPSMSATALLSMIKDRGKTFKSVQFVPELGALPAEDVRAVNLDGLLALEVRTGLYSLRNRFFKRVLDLVGGTIVTVLISPLLALLYAWIRLESRGPALYGSERIGQRGQVFRCLKFRTMYIDADVRLAELLENHPTMKEEYAKYHKLQNDPRVTRVGRILRSLSLDELPQIYNILKGEMSLVGPRPYLTRELSDMNGFEHTILEVKPGMTGYWQVSGRNNITFQDRLEMEAFYVRNWSIWWDIIILFKTALVVVNREGAR